MTRKRWLRDLERRYGSKNPAVKAAWLVVYFRALRDGRRLNRKAYEGTARQLNEYAGKEWTIVNSTPLTPRTPVG